VLQRIQEAGYTPNINAQRLVVGRTQMIALDFGNWPHALSNMFFVELTRGIQDALEEQGYGLLLNTKDSVLQRWVQSRAVDGVILARGNVQTEDIAQEIISRGTPSVVIGHHAIVGLPSVGSVIIGLREGARQVAQMLVEYGHRRIGFLGNNEPQNVVHVTFRDELKRLGVDLREDFIINGNITPEDGERGALVLLSRPDPPTAIFTRSDALAAGVLRAARKQGLHVPTELSVVGHDDVPFAELAEPPLTTVRINCAELGRLATQTLLELLSQPDHCPEAQVVQTELVMRESVARPMD
jgi:DNA-binding LacI/PurR family transcriptional regulator